MAQTIKLKRSATSGAVPSTASLELGEVAINTYDGKMYIKKNVVGTETIVEVGAGGAGGLASVSYLEAGMIEYEYTATLNQTTFSGADDNSATLSYTAESILVFLNGVLQDDGLDYTATDGSSVVFSVGLAAADEVRIVSIANVTTLSTLNNPTKLDAISTVDGQAAYSLTLDTSAYTPSSETALIVSLNGITQEPGDSFTTSGSTITFAPALVTGDVIDYIVDMGRAVPIGEYSGDFVVGGNLTVGGYSTFSGDIIMSGFPESIYELKGDLDGGIRFAAQAGEALSKGDIVYISGAAGANTIVSKAQANSSSTMPAFGFALADASNGASCQIVTFGNLYGSGGAPLDTSAFNVGDTLYVSATTAGGFTSTPPTGESNLLQNIGKIVRKNSNNGVIKVGGAGRTNAVPNLDDGDIFIGNASNQAVTTTLDTSIVPENTNLYYTDARVDSRLASGNVGNIVTTGYLRGPATFTIDPAAHGDNTGTLVVAGNLQVDGTTTTINSTTMTVDDLNITLASGAANAAAANGAGITVDGASATLTYNSTPDAWSFNKNVGIGTDSPATLLDVASSGEVIGTVRSTSTSGARQATLRLNVASSGGDDPAGKLEFTYGTGYTVAGSIEMTHNSNNMKFATGATERMRIDSSGNVGIGTSSPFSTARLQVKTGTDLNLAVQTGTTLTSGMKINAFNDAANANIPLELNGSELLLKTNEAERMRIDASGNVGIGTTSPDATIEISRSNAGIIQYITNTGSAQAYTAYGNSDNPPWSQDFSTAGGLLVGIDSDETGVVYQGGNYALRFGTNAAERMRIDSSGSVGIGTGDPAANLDVSTATGNTTFNVTNNDGFFQIQKNADDVYFNLIDTGNMVWRNGAGSATRMTLDATGNVTATGAVSGSTLQASSTGFLKGVTGDYGSIEVDGNGKNSWEGYSIGGRSVFMHDNSTTTGLYNDVHNHWLVRSLHQGGTYLYHNGAAKIETTSTGAQITGSLTVGGITSSGLVVGTRGAAGFNSHNDVGNFSVRGDTSYGAIMSFHRVGAYAVNFGLDSDNVFKLGGWSASTVKHYWDMAGNYTAVGDVTAFSDERLKSDIETLDGSKVYEMRGVSFTKDGEAGSGVIAQELQKVAPELVHESGEYLSVAYGNLVGYLIEAVKELKAEIDELKGVK